MKIAQTSLTRWWSLLSCAALLAMSMGTAQDAMAQQSGEIKEEAKKAADAKKDEAKKLAEAKKVEVKTKADAKADEAKKKVEAKAAEAKKAAKKSADGSPQWKRSFGAGLELGTFFTSFGRYNAKLLEPNGLAQFDTDVALNLDLAFEISPLEGTRFTVFGGAQGPFTGDPSISALYAGVEPAFAYRRDKWELALGMGIGFGAIDMKLDSGQDLSAGLVLVRPYVEARRYANEMFAAYMRVGFNYWATHSLETSGIAFNPSQPFENSDLNEGGIYAAVGVRFGSYPEHIKSIPDTDGDGLKDDIDECPDKPEDKDGFQDEDGCPELDNDGDGINDDKDKCPLVAEDKDGWKDDDGCPEDDDDKDGDGILDKNDKCPDQAEDKDGWKDEDGCPEDDDDRDGDGVLDKDDKCPDKPGVPQKQGCPFQRVEVTLKKIVIREKIFFELDKAVIQQQSFSLLDEIAKVFNDNPRIKLVEIQGHTDSAGKASYNKKLSERRAQAVVDYLVKKGVAKDRLTAKGFGFTEPLVPLEKGKKETPEAAEKNRRVEFLILKQDEIKKTVREDELKKMDKDKLDKVEDKGDSK